MSAILYTFLTLVGGVSAFELAASASASTQTCPSLIFNTLNLFSSGRSALLRRSPAADADLMWIDDFNIEPQQSGEQFCTPDHTHFAIALCIYFASVTTLYRRYQNNQQLRSLVMVACIGLPVAAGLLSGQTVEYISVAIVPFMAWAGLATMPLLVWLAKQDFLREMC